MLKNDCSDNTLPFLKTIIYETKRIQREAKNSYYKKMINHKINGLCLFG